MARRKNRKPATKIDEIANSVPKMKEIADRNDGTMENKPKNAPTKNQKTKPLP